MDHRRLMQQDRKSPGSAAIMVSDSTDNGFCQQKNWDGWMVEIVTVLGNLEVTMTIVDGEGIAYCLQPGRR